MTSILVLLHMALDSLVSVWEHEPVVIVGLANAVLDLLVAFGVPVTSEQKLMIGGAIGAVSVVLLRASVYSPATANDDVTQAHITGFMDALQETNTPEAQAGPLYLRSIARHEPEAK